MHSKTIHALYLGENSVKLTQMLQQDPSSGSTMCLRILQDCVMHTATHKHVNTILYVCRLAG